MNSKKINILDKEKTLERISCEQFSRRTLSFYRYVKIANPQEMRDKLFVEWSELGVFGRVYVATEGINAQISVPIPNWDKFLAHLNSFPEFKDVPLKIALEEPKHSFLKLKIKVRHQIVADGLAEDTYDLSNIGKHLTAKEWNEAMSQDGTIVVDMRNAYEGKIGKFKDAIVPDVDRFKDELPLVKEMLSKNKDSKILLYCTGGVRCEKASAYLKNDGFKDVNQLHGGIIAYADQVKAEGLENKFIGKNFVFDDRLAERVSDDVISKCDVCGCDSDDITNCKNKGCDLLFVECDDCCDLLENCCSLECNAVIHKSKEEQRKIRQALGPSNDREYRTRVRPNLKPLNIVDKLILWLRKKISPLNLKDKEIQGQYLGHLSHIFSKTQVAEFILLKGEIKKGDVLKIYNLNKELVEEVVIETVFANGNQVENAKMNDVVTFKFKKDLKRKFKVYK